MRIRDWSSDVCSSDLLGRVHRKAPGRIRRSGARRRFPGLNAASAQALRRPPLPILNTSMPETGEYRSEERRVGKECVSTCRSRGSPYNSKKKNKYMHNNITDTKT